MKISLIRVKSVDLVDCDFLFLLSHYKLIYTNYSFGLVILLHYYTLNFAMREVSRNSTVNSHARLLLRSSTMFTESGCGCRI